ncbi:hypothetical protein NUM3379_25260 [Kineococcus sp. NUM-3379]
MWQRSHRGRLLHALPHPGTGPPPSGPALCGTWVQVDLRHRPAGEEPDRERCHRCLNAAASAAGALPEAEPGMLF